jgi:hypothetical protein
MNVAPRPVLNTGLITPRSMGYSYAPGNVLAGVTRPARIATFGTPFSPKTPGVPISPILSPTPKPVGPAQPVNGINHVAFGLFA